MANYHGIPEMLEGYMAESGDADCWVTVGELRERFGFSRRQCTSVSRFLRRLHEGTYRNYPYIVQCIERDPACRLSEVGVLRYRIRKRGGIPAFAGAACRLEGCHATE